jgi:ribosome-associated protein
MLTAVTASLEGDKAEDIVVIELAGKSTLADYMVIATGTSRRQVGTMAEHLRERIKGNGAKGVSIEGKEHCDWVLIDAGDIVVHLFRPEVRAFYALERMWGQPQAVTTTETGVHAGIRG